MLDPETGQFISADSIEDDLNTYRYVRNNPVNLSDPSGAVIPWLAILGLAALGALEGAIIGGISALINCTNFWEEVLIGGLTGAILGPLVGGLVAAGGWLIRRWGGGLIKGAIKHGADDAGEGLVRSGWRRLRKWFRRGNKAPNGQKPQLMAQPSQLQQAKPIMTQWGWKGSNSWRAAVKEVATGGEKGVIRNLNGKVPTYDEAVQLIQDGGGTIQRVEGPHAVGGVAEHIDFNHINYTTASGVKGHLAIQTLP